MRVLFVEDEPNDYFLYIDAIRADVARRGGELDLVRTVEEALCRLERNAYDAAIIDLNIPLGANCRDGYEDGELNGKHVVDYLRHRDASSTRIICLTNYVRRAEVALEDVPGITILAKSSRRDVLVKAVFP